ncbi:sxtJ [Desertifilum sp. FACHB-1129]|uniref:SxtJ n=2 Tax=Desertifilum tharense IPPAS B-1220 TaxID=1781255 RepID=A0A1E5QIJ8_9CYAN|nr:MULTISPECIES: SxtJ family membrane protein [Desertifilum]MDA0211324.1 SxtJ family membrane protein [Cyanobacteria bacterium FC1]MBD2314655.1 sxtJ [Desertifilum sp. FACHB-1129]MBD2320285.1 sxtJ [Desertifilum sp. FACHB-866]MBD2330413.1 sxtJ [Desertifilum sp. FACHB-868]OEJ74163.1 sxtJ [Desertifilum tharense IPPAS B-1220]
MHAIPQLDRKGLRDFGLLFGFMMVLVFGLVGPLLFRHSFPLWPWIVAGVFWVWALALPQTLDPFYQLWARFGLVMGWINTRLILGIIFYLITTPMGIVMRLMGNDPMQRQWKRDALTYRVPSQVRTRESMERPF